MKARCGREAHRLALTLHPVHQFSQAPASLRLLKGVPYNNTGLVNDLERHRLKEVRRDDLAHRVDWVSQTVGDGLGFDILSFDDADDSERMLEVKATGLGKFFPFYVTANEVRCSDDVPGQYHLFRVFNVGREPQIYILHGSLKVLCQLEPVLFRAFI